MIDFKSPSSDPALPRLTDQAVRDSDATKEFLSLRAEAAPNENEFITRLRKILPFDAICISGLNIDGCGLGRGVYLFNSSPKDFARFYTQERFIAVDPLYRNVVAHSQPVTWDMCMAAPRDADDRRKSASLFACLKVYDIAPRTVLTLWGPNGPYGSITLARHRAFSERELTALAEFGEPMHRLMAAPIIAKLRHLGRGTGSTTADPGGSSVFREQ
jgi:hypothetical protein